MSRRIGAAVVVMVALFAAAMLIVWINSGRAVQDRVYCENNLRVLARAAEVSGLNLPPGAVAGVAIPAMNARIPPGTIVNPTLPPDERLSWVVPLLPLYDQRRQDTASLLGQIDLAASWNAPPNATPSRTRLSVVTCLGNPPEPSDGPAPSQYVGAGGVGPDGASLPLSTGWPPVAPPRAGCFRYDAPTPYPAITDGLSTSVLFAETSSNLGPWIRGGTATVRSLIVDGTIPVLGTGGQFGGNHPGGGNFAFADGSVRFLTNQTSPAVLEGLFTIAGGASDPLPGE